MPREWWEYESDPIDDTAVEIRRVHIDLQYSVYRCHQPSKYNQEDRRLAMPIAEVICMLKRQPVSNYEKYIDMACEIMELNLTNNKKLSWVQDTCHENQSVYEAWAQWRMMKALCAPPTEF
jgi:hypothetical protein